MVYKLRSCIVARLENNADRDFCFDDLAVPIASEEQEQ